MKKWIGAAFVISVAGASGLFALKLRHRHQFQQRVEAAPPLPPLPPWGELAVTEAIYDGKLGAGWQDWGWGPHELPKTGPAKIIFAGYGGIIFRHDSLMVQDGLISFRYKAPADWADFLQVSLKSSLSSESQFPELAVDADHTKLREDGWREVRLAFAALNPQNSTFDRVAISARTMVASEWVTLDRVVLAKWDQSAATQKRTAALQISCSPNVHPISPLIYGSAVGVWESGTTANRIGGNPTSRYNWELGAWNSAKDWFFENGKSVDLGAVLDEGQEHHGFTALTVPILGWVAKDTTSVGYPAPKFPGQRKYDPYRAEAGDGFRLDGKPITPGPPSETSMPAPPEMIGGWIRHLRDKDRVRGSRGVQMYILDNEPGLWNSTHHDIHPDPLTYDELLDRTLRYATEIRKADPEALIAGPAEWGWLGYHYSARDLEVGKFLRPDRRMHGDVPLIPWYLAQIAEHEKSSGTRLLDYLDVHYYPAAERVYGDDGAVDAAGRQLRLRATRSLWDPEYTDESWIDEKIRLIPRLKAWVSENHPGLKISLGEWSFGGEHDISGALATAESLGRFGQQGLDAAFYWGGPKPGTSTYWAFRAYRNFDGNGARFLDDALETRGDDSVSLFASRDPADNRHIVAIVVNRDAEFQITAHIELESCGQALKYRAFGYHAGSPSLEPVPNNGVDADGLTAVVPPYALQVIDLTLE
ncbi:MAG: glycoside hydrolase family 44 protein [Polyangiaceae bacterium]